MDEPYPPKNRLQKKLPPLVIQVIDRRGEHRFEPNGLVLHCLKSEQLWEPIQGEVSDISGLDLIVFYESDDLRIRLCTDELRRMTLCSLRPDEYVALRDKFGMAFEWHSDFYDPETGIALQPKE